MAVSMRALRAHRTVGVTATRSSAQKVAPLATARSSGRTTIASAGSVFLGASVKAPSGLSVARVANTRALRLETRAAGIADFTADSIDGKPVKLSTYVGKVSFRATANGRAYPSNGRAYTRMV